MTLCRLDELKAGEARRFEIDGLVIAVVRIGADVFAIGDRCITRTSLCPKESSTRTN